MIQPSKQKHIAVIYHYFASYRKPIIDYLSEDKTNRYHFYSGTKTNKKIKIIDFSTTKTVPQPTIIWHKLNNYWFGKAILWQTGVIKIAFQRRYDTLIFFGQMGFLSTWLAATIGRLTGKKILMWTHGFIREERGLKKHLRCTFYKIPHHLLLYGDRAKQIMQSYGFAKHTLHVIYNSLDRDKQLNVISKFNNETISRTRKNLFNNNHKIVIFIGRLTKRKQLSLLLEAIAILKEEDIIVNTLLVGNGDEKQNLHDQTKCLGLEKQVLFYGECFREDEVGKLLYLSDCCVSPGDVGLAAIHSLGYGTPVVTHDNPSQQMPEFESIITNETGLFFNQGSSKDLAFKIKLITHSSHMKISSKNCMNIIDSHYNPNAQAKTINALV